MIQIISILFQINKELIFTCVSLAANIHAYLASFLLNTEAPRLGCHHQSLFAKWEG